MIKQPVHRNKLTTFVRNEDGIMAVIFAMMLPVFIVVAALAIDMGYAYWKRNIIQVDASVSALAGAGIAMDDASIAMDGSITYTLIDKDSDGAPDNDDIDGDSVPDGAVILIEALAYAEKTIAGEGILATVDVLPGNWDQGNRIFTSAGTWDTASQLFTTNPIAYDTLTGNWAAVADPVVPLNAVMTTTRRASGFTNNNPLPLFLAGVIGRDDIDISTSAIVAFAGGDLLDLDACITALNSEDNNSFYINGSALVEAPGCDIHIYSNDPCAIRAVGTPEVSVVNGLADTSEACASNPLDPEECYDDGEIYTGEPEDEGNGTCDTPQVEWTAGEPEGGLVPKTEIPFGWIYPPNGNCGWSDGPVVINDTDYCNLFTVEYAVESPYDEFDVDDGITRAPGCDEGQSGQDYHEEDYIDGLLTLGTPGQTTIFCGGISVFGPSGSTVEFAGNIVISGGEFEVAATVAMKSSEDASFPGMGVFLMDSARVNMHGSPGGSAGVGLVAQTEGPLADFIFFEDPNSSLEGLPGNPDHSLRGTPNGAFGGILFFQNSTAEYKGTADSLVTPESGCTVLIADKIYFNGTTQFAAGLSTACSTNLPSTGIGNMKLAIYF